jgi:glutamate 5-kinase
MKLAANSRIVLKVGSSTLTGSAGAALDTLQVDRLVDLIAELRNSGHEVVLVSSGAIATGLAPLRLLARPKDLATQQAAAAIGQGLLIGYYNQSFSRHQLIAAQVLLTIEDVVRRSHYLNAQRTLDKLLQLGSVPIINENDSVGVQEIKFGDNDRLAALVANLVNADLLVLVTDIDSLYDAPPATAGAKRISEVVDVTNLPGVEIGGVGSSGVGSGGMVTKIEAARIATNGGVAMLLTTLANLPQAFAGEDVGTYFHATGEKMPARALWLAHAARAHGQLTIDDGAVKALRERGVSLLAAGVISSDGEFQAGDLVEVLNRAGQLIARGISNFDSSELPKLLGKSTKELANEFGPEYEREVIHRDDMVLS